MSEAAPKAVLAFLKKAHDAFQPLSEKICFDKKHALHNHVIALYGSILELTGSCILLVDQKLISGVPILVRAIVEGYVDLFNLVRDAEYGYRLRISYLKEWLKILEEAKAGKNKYLQDIYKQASLDKTIMDWKSEKDRLQANGYKALTIKDKFKIADMEDEYCSLYNSLCSDSHNNLRALFCSHIEIKQNDFSVVFYKDYTIEDSAIYVGTMAELLMRSTQLVHSFFNSPSEANVARYRQWLDTLRGDE
jgi:hypothetical protein